jgi:hypothetical protein
MITQPEPVNFPICFRHKSGTIYGYLDNGFCLVVTPSTPLIMLNDYHSKFSTFEMYKAHISELKTDRVHELISRENYDQILNKSLEAIFNYVKTDIIEVSLESVKKRRSREFGYYKND